MLALSTVVATAGFVVVCISAWHAICFRDGLKLAHEHLDSLPLNIFVELVAGSVLACIGGLKMAGELRPITFLASEQSLRVHTHRLGFMTFNHRMKTFRELSE